MPKSPNVQGKTRKKNTFSQENVSVIFFRYKIPKHRLTLPVLQSLPLLPLRFLQLPEVRLSP